MALLLTKKSTNEQDIFGSYVAIEEKLKIKARRLEYYFKKDGIYEDRFFKIERKEIIRSNSHKR